MGISVCAYSSLILGLWFGWETMYRIFLSQGAGGSLLLKALCALGAIAFLSCFVGLRQRKIWAWFLFLILVMRLAFYDLVGICVFFHRLAHGGVFSLQYEVLVGIMGATITIILLSFVWILTKPSVWGQFKIPVIGRETFRSPKRMDRLHWFAGVSLATIPVLSVENVLTPDIRWGLAWILLAIAIGTSWLVALSHRK